MTAIVPASGSTLREHLEQFRDFIVAQSYRPKPGSELEYAGDLDLVLRHGREYRSVPWATWRGRGYRRGRVRECFLNAARLGFRHEDELTYVEGFASSGLLPVHHAWLVDREGRVVDPTWRDDDPARPVETWEYLGVPFSWDFAGKIMAAKGTYGILDDFDIYKRPLPDGAVRQEA